MPPKDKKEASRKYYLSHREEALAYQANRRKENPEASSEIGRKYYSKNPEKYRSRSREYKTAITEERYQKIFKEQNGNCALCGNPETVVVKRTGELLPLSVDHDHSCCLGGRNSRACGKCFRGLICSSCNKGLGYFKDSIINLEKAIEYLKRTMK